jgi:hypothetical protein
MGEEIRIGGGPEGVEYVAAGGEAVEVLVGERAEVLVADGADRPRGGGHVGGGGGIQRGAGSSSCGLALGRGRETKRFRIFAPREFSKMRVSWREIFISFPLFYLYCIDA